MTHVQEHCKLPTTFRRRIGDVWACNCGQLYYVIKDWGSFDSYKVWRPIEKELK